MIHGPERRLRAAAGADAPSWRGPESRQTDTPRDRTAAAATDRPAAVDVLLRVVTAPLYACMQGVMAIATAASFQRMQVVHRGRFPERGPAVLIANHPAAWTDVVVLDVAFGRKLHFLAHESLFRPWLRGLLLRLYGTLPVVVRPGDPEGGLLNRATFDRCRALLARGEVIAVFPEGVSEDDRALKPLKTGAARLLLERPEGDAWPAVPVAIHYGDRCRFRDRVTLAVGEPLSAAPFRDRRRPDPDGAARALTAAMADALQRAMADATIAASRARPPRRRGAAASAVIAVFGGLGQIVHAPAVALVETLARRFMGSPQRLQFGRIVLGIVLVPVWYAILSGLVFARGGVAWLAVEIVLPALGVLACFDVDRRRAAVRGRRGPPP